MDPISELYRYPALAIALAARALLVVGIPVSYALVWLATARMRGPEPFGVSPLAWDLATRTPSALSGITIGVLERYLFFGGLLANIPEVIVGWLAFKVASKWEAWHNIVQPPASNEHLDPIEFLRARHLWGSRVLTRVLVGTVANILLAGLAVVIVRALARR